MRVELGDAKKETTFQDLAAGQTFSVKDGIDSAFIKLDEPLKNGYALISAVGLKNGHGYNVEGERVVTPLNLVARLEEV